MRARTSYLSLAPVGVLLVGLGAGCVHEKGESQLGWLQTGLEKEFPDHRATVDLSGSSDPRRPPPSPVLAAPSAPKAEEAEPAREEAEPTPSGGRTVIRVVGTGKTHGKGDLIQITDEAESPKAATPSPSRGAAALSKAEYEHALSLLNARDYDHASEALLAFLARWPEDPNVEAALFWSGECYLAKGELLDAKERFEAVLARFPQGNKAPDALLELGVTADRLGNKETAKSYFERLAHDYPRSDALRRIPRASGVKL
jgi:tol-pal system protein YbgF